MSFSAVEKPLVSRDQEPEATRTSRIPRITETPESPIISTRELAPLWIELESNVESGSDKSDHNTASICTNPTLMMRDFTNPVDSENLYTSSLRLKTALTDEKRDHDTSYDQESARSSKGDVSVASTIESDIEFPSTLRVLFVTVSLAIAIFLVGLDRTIVATAT